MSKLVLKTVAFLLLFAACTPSESITKPEEPNISTISYLETFLELSNDGVVWGDFTGTIDDKGFEFGKVIIVAKSKENTLNFEGKVHDNVFLGTMNDQVTSFQINKNGSAVGKTDDGIPLYLLPGELLQQAQVQERLAAKGALVVATNFEKEKKLPSKDVLATFWYEGQGENRIELAFVFPTKFSHPSYGKQPKIRNVIFQKRGGEWEVEEDNATYKSKK